MLDEGLILQMIVYLLSIGAFSGTILHRIGQLEKKVEKHNSLLERMALVERDVRALHKRMDSCKIDYR